MSWHTRPLAAFDLETSGVDIERDRIVTATVVRIDGSSVAARNWMVNPGMEIPQAAIDVHGITNDEAREFGIDPATAAAQIFAELDACWSAGMPVIGFNIAFDLSLLDRELRRHCGTELGEIGPVIDPSVIDRHLDKWRKGSRKLDAVCAHYGVRLEGAHTSSGDALATARLAWKLAQVFPDDLAYDGCELPELHAKQQAWRAEWAVDFEAYLRRQGNDGAVDGSWPIRPFVEPSFVGSAW